jgi:8-oxo-dGTP pyrophosphatase MutT (NUDIX family)
MPGFTSLPDWLRKYGTQWPEELTFKDQFQELLLHPRAYHRDHLPGHITGSAWVVNAARSKVLLLHHKKLNRWLQPGGHADGDENVLQVALRELQEETGLQKVKQLIEGIFDLDIHPIPTRKDFPAHDHYDVRFLFEADERSPIMVSEESFAVKWILFEELNLYTDNTSVHRMAAKTLDVWYLKISG